MVSNVIPDARPLLRGYIHLVAAVTTPPALVMLLILSDSPRDYVGAAIFGASLILVFTTSAIYHVVSWNDSHRSVVRRMDHAMIYILIGGTYTPFMLKLLGNAWGISVLSVVWGLAGVGIIMKVLVPRSPRWLGVSTYLAIGWIGLIPIVQVAAALPLEALLLLIAGGLLYSSGGLVYLFRRPDPVPRVFGYHETFHTMVVFACGIFYYVVAVYVLPY
ncbi:MAG: hemolysin III family protein [Chloroflexi bacterium]|nr:hemolysin III family protein [Chloroflexota bacterium]